MAKREKSAPAASTRSDVVIGGQRMDIAYHEPAIQPTNAGPWRVEPDKIAWTDRVTGYCCIIRREHGGHLGAYVGLPKGHMLYGYEADAIPPDVVSVPGGLDYAAPCDQRGPESRSICHVRGNTHHHDDLWWVGTVCNGLTDLVPDDAKHAAEAQRLGIRQTYRDAKTLYDICTDLAAELKALESDR
ncbi:hypothetical protein [Sphingomonas sp.]|uniref:hypothetical protein n=1 Tax=Sphingomonas sp. TaxID=28214 RepID=UPI0031E45699